jgi:hypothetical protein
MDLVTLIAACALSVEPKVMHALIWKQSGGETSSFSVPGESLPRVLPTIQDAIREARAVRPNGGRIRVGLTGLSIDPRSATAVLFAPCLNITVAARPITQLAERCKTTSKPDPIYCAVAAYRGSCDRPDPRFADAVRATVEKGSAPNFDMPKDAYFDSNDVAFDTLRPGPHATLSAPALKPDDRERGWSSALFPAKTAKPEGASVDMQNHGRAAGQVLSPGPASATPTASKATADSLCPEMEAVMAPSRNVGYFRTFDGETGDRRPPDRPMAR